MLRLIRESGGERERGKTSSDFSPSTLLFPSTLSEDTGRTRLFSTPRRSSGYRFFTRTADQFESLSIYSQAAPTSPREGALEQDARANSPKFDPRQVSRLKLRTRESSANGATWRLDQERKRKREGGGGASASFNSSG